MRKDFDIENDLIQWGMWSKDDECERLGYPPMTAFRRLAGATLDWDYDIKEVPVYQNINDEYAAKLDKLISSLELDLKTAVYLRYVERMKMGKIEKSMRLRRNEASSKLETAKRVLSHLLMGV